MSIPFVKMYTTETKALTANLTQAQKAKIFDAILDYGLFEIWEIDTENSEKFLYISEQIKEQISKGIKEYKEVCKRNKRIAKERNKPNPDDTTGATSGGTTGEPPVKPKENQEPTSQAPNSELLTLNSEHITLNTETTKEKIDKKETPEFVQFWNVYPKGRAGSKEKAANAFFNALDRHKKEGLTAERIIFGATVYAKSNEGTGPYVKGAAAWLNDDRFLIDYAALDAKQPKHFNKPNALPSPVDKYDVE
ncbi:hypothetical protein Dip510_001624 [Elusimicrobium posterum]|uniref:DUF6291 domain-containing protein n=1 Tax=Elusimicrobium posterum TaxID=3116653 RepID=UPI003C7594A1